MWQKKMVQTSRGEFETFVAGDGAPLCVTHLYSEFNEKGNYFADTFVRSFKVHLVNLKEAGNSSAAEDDEDLSMESSVRDLEAVRTALGIEKWGFAGHSTGGMLGLVYGILFPESLTKLMVGGATASNAYMEHKDSIYCKRNPLNARLLELLEAMTSADSTREKRVKASREWTEMSLYYPEKFDNYFSIPSSGKVVPKRLDYYSYVELPDFDLRGELYKVDVPAIVFCGKHDVQCPFVFSEEIDRLLPHSILFAFEKSNHSPFLEEKDAFWRMVDEFLNL